MAWTPLLFSLLTIHADSVASSMVTQPSTASVPLTQTVTITCQGEPLKSGYAAWYQQKPDQAPVMIIYGNNKWPSGIPDRFSGTYPDDKSILTISGAQDEDEADYYCAVWDSNDSSFHSDTGRWESETQTSSLCESCSHEAL